MSREQQIKQLLQAHFSPQHLKVINESSAHRVPVNSETHFKVVLVSDFFTNQPRVERHRMVNRLLQNEFESGLHALALHLYTSTEWKTVSNQFASPPCQHIVKE
jgi:BolA protein